jgi:hypothetical protein
MSWVDILNVQVLRPILNPGTGICKCAFHHCPPLLPQHGFLVPPAWTTVVQAKNCSWQPLVEYVWLELDAKLCGRSGGAWCVQTKTPGDFYKALSDHHL